MGLSDFQARGLMESKDIDPLIPVSCSDEVISAIKEAFLTYEGIDLTNDSVVVNF